MFLDAQGHHTVSGKEIWLNSDASSMFKVGLPQNGMSKYEQPIGKYPNSRPQYFVENPIRRPSLSLVSAWQVEVVLTLHFVAKPTLNIEETSEFIQISFPDTVGCPWAPRNTFEPVYTSLAPKRPTRFEKDQSS